MQTQQSKKDSEPSVYDYRIYRSPVQPMYVNIVAMDEQENIIAIFASDLTVDEAQEMYSMLNSESEKQS